MKPEIRKIINSQVKVGFSTNRVPISYYFDKIDSMKKQGYKMDYKPTKDGMAISVWKIVKNFPINVVECKTSDGDVHLLKGWNDIMNIREWIYTDAVVSVCGEELQFSKFNEESQRFLTERNVCSIYMTSTLDDEKFQEMYAYEVIDAYTKLL